MVLGRLSVVSVLHGPWQCRINHKAIKARALGPHENTGHFLEVEVFLICLKNKINGELRSIFILHNKIIRFSCFLILNCQ